MTILPKGTLLGPLSQQRLQQTAARKQAAPPPVRLALLGGGSLRTFQCFENLPLFGRRETTDLIQHYLGLLAHVPYLTHPL